ncbi:hypothetical protein EVC62_02655 [Salinicola endophyticus]|uniref:DUF3108 domain-containing protein n=1 Tax=Salinicola endophyticus TaxID=1949083 RepID=A0ABY8FCJ2_9GAMM|nr:hypothetical protein [Salinicola endophyticus]WFF40490.1 hypothetical protein EVC62_02655 [Salinicola endophyticus]
MPYLTSMLLSLALLLLSATTALAQSAPTPFVAHYRLAISGWPDATITHRLSQHGSVWESTMQASLKIAHGEERGRFAVEGDDVQAIDYTSGYSLLGIGDDYHLNADQLKRLPDRQTALFELARTAPEARCRSDQVSPCQLTYQDHKGRDKTLYYRVTGEGEVTTPAGKFPGVSVDTWDADPDKRGRHLFLTFDRDVPGLLLASRYVRDGEQRSQLSLLDVSFPRDKGVE